MSNGKYNWGLIARYALIVSSIIATFAVYGWRLEAIETAQATTSDDHTKLQIMENVFERHIDDFKDFRTEQRKFNEKLDGKQDRIYEEIMKLRIE